MIYVFSGVYRQAFFLALCGLFLNSSCQADLFLLKNGKSLEGTLKSEGADYYEVEIAGGSTRLNKNTVSKVEKERRTLTPRDEFEQKRQEAETPEALVAAADFGFKNGFDAEALSILKRVWVQGGRKDGTLMERIRRLEEKQLSEISNEAQNLFASGNFRQCAALLNQTLKQEFLSNTVSLLQLRKQAYDNLDTEQASRDYLEKLLREQTRYVLAGEKGAPKNTVPSAAPPKQDSKSPSAEFPTRAKKLDPVYSSLIDTLSQMFELKPFLEREKYGTAAFQDLHSVKELDASRANPKEFNRLRSENNKIYKARKLCRQYNYLLDEANEMLEHVQDVVQKESATWIANGYEKVNGRWLKGDAAKEAKGMTLYRGEWLDTKSPDFEKQKAEIDKKHEIVQMPVEEKPAPVATKEKALPASQDDTALLEDRSAKNLADHIKAAVKEEVTEAVTQKVEETKKQVKIIQQAVEEETPEKAKGLPLSAGLGLIVGILLLLKLSKRKK